MPCSPVGKFRLTVQALSHILWMKPFVLWSPLGIGTLATLNARVAFVVTDLSS